MKARYRLTPKADQDLAQIWRHTNENLGKEDRFIFQYIGVWAWDDRVKDKSIPFSFRRTEHVLAPAFTGPKYAEYTKTDENGALTNDNPQTDEGLR